jgi:hypothetical protein
MILWTIQDMRASSLTCLCEGPQSRSNLGGIPHLHFEQLLLTAFAGLYIIFAEG